MGSAIQETLIEQSRSRYSNRAQATYVGINKEINYSLVGGRQLFPAGSNLFLLLTYSYAMVSPI